MPDLILTKHHGLGNDFLVLLDLEGTHVTTGPMARELCDRRRGVGADGFITVGRDERDTLVMELRNADGGIAEMSGNGIRCMAQAAEMAGLVAPGDELVVLTGAGEKRLWLERATGQDGVSQWRVDMGPAKVVDASDDAVSVDMGNPHLVLHDRGQDLEALGMERPDVNIELVRVDGPDTVVMRVWERGVGLTLACGTGSCATVAATAAWGLTGPRATVHNPGGALVVEVGQDTVMLTGPAQYVARVEVPWR